MTYNNAIQIFDSINVKTKDGYLYYHGMLIGKTYIQAISDDSFMCDVLNKERISTIEELKQKKLTFYIN